MQFFLLYSKGNVAVLSLPLLCINMAPIASFHKAAMSVLCRYYAGEVVLIGIWD